MTRRHLTIVIPHPPRITVSTEMKALLGNVERYLEREMVSALRQLRVPFPEMIPIRKMGTSHGAGVTYYTVPDTYRIPLPSPSHA